MPVPPGDQAWQESRQGCERIVEPQNFRTWSHLGAIYSTAILVEDKLRPLPLPLLMVCGKEFFYKDYLKNLTGKQKVE